MKLKPVIDRLKASAATLQSRIAGSAEFAAAAQAQDLAVPCAFVMPLAESVHPSRTAPRVVQTMEERFGIIVCVSNLVDPRGQAGAEQLDDIRTELWSALIDWSPGGGVGPFEYRGSRHLAMTRGRLWHQYDFAALNVIATL